jgi:hypothetical protein
VHDSLVTAAFSGLFLLKMANLYPAELDLGAITGQVEQLAQLLSDVAAERYVFRLYLCMPPEPFNSCSYALTLRVMLANLRRKVGILTDSNASVSPSSIAGGMQQGSPEYGVSQPLTTQELGFAYTGERAAFSPSAIPVWLQEQVGWIFCNICGLSAHRQLLQSLTDLSLPANGSDGIFLQVPGANGWTGDFAPMPEAW